MAKTEVKMAVDPFRVIAAALRKAERRPPSRRLVSVDYDERADVLYARYSFGKIVDSEPLDPDGMIMGSLDMRHRIVGLVVLHASTLS